MQNKRATGTCYENIAADYLTDNGVEITDRNFRCRCGEIDLVGRERENDGQTVLVFFEVKFRMDNGCGYASQAVTPSKCRKICRVSDYYRLVHGVMDNVQVRYDIIAFDGENLSWIKNAFDYCR